MATKSLMSQARPVVVYAKEVNLADVSASDVVVGPTVPAGSVILYGGLVVTEVHAGTSTDCALDVGVTGGDVDNFVDGFDFDAASLGDQGFKVAQTPVVVTSEDTVDVLVQAQTGTTTAGKVQVWVAVVDTNEFPTPGTLAQPGS